MATDLESEPIAPLWPLSFQMLSVATPTTSPSEASDSFSSIGSTDSIESALSANSTNSTDLVQPTIPTVLPTQFWTHELYQGPEKQPVEVFYTKMLRQSEAVAAKFLDEKVLGFDTECKPYLKKDECVPIQQRISVIQIACEDKIALFHIGQHWGSTPDDLLAPSLRKIIESPDIIKTGVSIKTADFDRLQEHFHLKPQGFFELSHLHNLVVHGPSNPEKCTKKIESLATQVEHHLGLPFDKNEYIRMSQWHLPLSERQKKYAAADAYVGFMLYHCMNAKRQMMDPPPPLPIFVEQYLAKEPNTRIKLLHTVDSTSTTITAFDFFKTHAKTTSSSSSPPPTDQNQDTTQSQSASTSPTRQRKRSRPSEAPLMDILTEPSSERLFQLLRDHRRTTAAAQGHPHAHFIVADDKTLREIARKCPRSEEELVRIRGIAAKKAAQYGVAWLAIVAAFLVGCVPGDYIALVDGGASNDVAAGGSGSDGLGEQMVKIEVVCETTLVS